MGEHFFNYRYEVRAQLERRIAEIEAEKRQVSIVEKPDLNLVRDLASKK